MPKTALARLVEQWDDTSISQVRNGRTKIIDAASSMADSATRVTDSKVVALFGHLNEKPCLIRTTCVSTSGYSQKDIRFVETNEHFMAHHVAWLAAYGPGFYAKVVKEGLEYGHRCHARCCIEPTHGHWVTSAENKDEQQCSTGSHWIDLKTGEVRVSCVHDPRCLVPKEET